ncbi:MAG: T9SS type A sorting domain-containing protein, partial [Bacteroidota bacterium]
GFESAQPTMWTVSLEGMAPTFTADLCMALTGDEADPGALVMLKREDRSQPWGLVPSELRPDTVSPTQLCALQVTSFSDFTIGQPATPLPVELVAFTARADGRATVLGWSTASETNNAGFEVEQQAGGQSGWETIAFVDGKGTTLQEQHYTYRADELTPGAHRFRLKQIDYDGAFEYSPVVEVAIELLGTHLLSAAHPNPFRHEVQFDVAVPVTQGVTIDLYNVLGQRVRRVFDGVLTSGTTQRFRLTGHRLPAGTYVVRAQGGYFMATQPIVRVD